MPLDLHQRLSEFSYGYGVTREVESHLQSLGLNPVPFLPSLLHEAEIGCDVHFDRPGVPILLQFKLGHELRRFHRTDLSKPAPDLDRPFWRFDVDTADSGGQYEVLLNAETAGAEVHYVAPRFADWEHYATAYERSEILDSSLLLTPSEIDRKLLNQGEADGRHRVVYDDSRVYVCSTPKAVAQAEFESVAAHIQGVIRERGEPLEVRLNQVFDGLSKQRAIRRSPSDDAVQAGARQELVAARQPTETNDQRLAARSSRLEKIRARSRTESDAKFAAIGLESWSVGAQLVIVTEL